MNVTFNIEATMEERWVNQFCSMLKHMEKNGIIGSSEIVGVYSDGDGDFRPKFKVDREFENQDGHPMLGIGVIFDAG